MPICTVATTAGSPLVNNHYLGPFTDGQGYIGDHGVTSHSGHMGVYVNDGSTTGVFTNFAVYPVHPPSSFWYV